MSAPGGDADLAAIGSLLAEPARAKILLALLDGRALPATMLASEAGVAPSTASTHLGQLLDGGLLTVEQHGRHRYYRLAGPGVARSLETLGQLAPVAPVRSLRDDTRARALRRARTCYDHVAGELGVELLTALLDRGALNGHDGTFRPGVDALSSPGPDSCYHLTDTGTRLLGDLGVDLTQPGRRPFIRHCVDWSEQRHHLAGQLGAAMTSRMFEAGWIDRGSARRTVVVTPSGTEVLRDALGIDGSRYR